jgi:hypothetical protein
MVLKFFVTTVLIALLSFIGGLFLPWWTIAVAAFLVSALIPQQPLNAFFAGFLSIFLLWGGMALVIDLANGSILSTRVAGILPLHDSPAALIVVTALVGALVGGGGALTAAFLQKRKPKAKMN